jgi:hypothetical protein
VRARVGLSREFPRFASKSRGTDDLLLLSEWLPATGPFM